eukprot:m.225824 g.225824  ORF g.225824 m.225824 type:complete len:126 (-) comp18786_c3_seq1:491-868(-)
MAKRLGVVGEVRSCSGDESPPCAPLCSSGDSSPPFFRWNRTDENIAVQWPASLTLQRHGCGGYWRQIPRDEENKNSLETRLRTLGVGSDWATGAGHTGAMDGGGHRIAIGIVVIQACRVTCDLLE